MGLCRKFQHLLSFGRAATRAAGTLLCIMLPGTACTPGLLTELDRTAPALLDADAFAFVEFSGPSSNLTTPTISGGDVEPGVTATLWVNDAACTLGGEIAQAYATRGGELTWSAFSVSGDGEKFFYYVLEDRNGNRTECLPLGLSYSLDTVAPEADWGWSLSQPTNGSASSRINPEFAFSGGEPGTTVRIHETSDCSGTAIAETLLTSATGSLEGLLVVDGSKSFRYQLEDPAGNKSTCESTGLGYNLDTVAPTVNLLSSPANPTYSRTISASLGGSDDNSGIAHYDCSLDGAAFGTCGAVFSSSGLLSGTHALSVRSVDSAGNISAAQSASFEIIPPQISDVYTGTSHVCALSNGRMICWGRDEYGELGQGSVLGPSEPVFVQNLGGVPQKVVIGGNTACAIVDGGVKCWGSNALGYLGNGTLASSFTPVSVLGLESGVTRLVAGAFHFCAIKNGGLWCWGHNEYGPLGRGTASAAVTTCSATPQQVWTNNPGAATACVPPVGTTFMSSGVEDVMVYHGHTCAKIAGALSCWGLNSKGECGIGNNVPTLLEVPTAVLGVGTQLRLARSTSGHYAQTTCVVQAGGVKCWGDNNYEPAGNGNNNSFLIAPGAKSIGLTSGVREVSPGRNYNCAVKTDGALHCWGKNTVGQLGLGDGATRTTPTATSLGSGVTKVFSGYEATFALKDGLLYGWGNNSFLQLGIGSSVASVNVPTLTTLNAGGVASVHSSSMAETTCGIVGGRLKCWGRNGSFSLLGNALTSDAQTAVANAALPAGDSILDVAVGSGHACAIADGDITCWGDNTYGQLGDGTQTSRSTPATVATASAHQVAVGGEFSCASYNGGVACWGKGSSGQLGSGSSSDSSVPVTVTSLGTTLPRKLVAGDEFACAFLDDRVACWGSNNLGQLGNDSSVNSDVPVFVEDSSTGVELQSGLADIAVGQNHACAVKNGGVLCWGNNAQGQVGTGDSTTSYDQAQPVSEDSAGGPVAVSDVSAIALGRNHSCMLQNGGVKCWGSNAYGQLGDGTTTARSLPVAVSGLTSGVEAITAGAYHTCAFTRGAVRCWGKGARLGDGTANSSSTPVTVHGL